MLKGRDGMVEPIIFERVDTRVLTLNQRVVCFCPGDDYPHVGQVCDCGFEMPDGIAYFGITNATSGNGMFPIVGTRCYQAVKGVFDARGTIDDHRCAAVLILREGCTTLSQRQGIVCLWYNAGYECCE